MIKITKQKYKQYTNTNIKQYYKQHLNQQTIINKDLGKILFTMKGLGETCHRLPKRWHFIICCLKELVEQGDCNCVKETLYKPRTDYITGFYHIYNTIKLLHITIKVDILIAEDRDGNKYYLFKTKKGSSPYLGEQSSSRGGNEPNNIITENDLKINSQDSFSIGETLWIGDCIKVTVENINMNEQLVYHGTNTQFQQFDKSFMDRMDYGYGFYFSLDKQYAKDYGKYLLTCEIPEDKYFLDFDMAWDINEYTQHCLVDLLIHLPHEKQETLEEVMYRGYCNNGFWILEALNKIYGSQEKACQELRKYGIKGLWSFNGNCYVVFDAQDIKIIKTELNEKYEKHNIFKQLSEHLQAYLNTNRFYPSVGQPTTGSRQQ